MYVCVRADRDFVLPGEVGPLAEQLVLRQREDARGLPDQHRVVQPPGARGRRDQVTALEGGDGERGTGEEGGDRGEGEGGGLDERESVTIRDKKRIKCFISNS